MDSTAARRPSEPLIRLATAHGVATDYWDWQGRPAPIAARRSRRCWRPSACRRIPPRQVEAALRERRRPVLAADAAGDGGDPRGVGAVGLRARPGRDRRAADHRPRGRPRVGGPAGRPPRGAALGRRRLVGEAAFELPWNLPLGWHRMVAHVDAEPLDRVDDTATVVVTPHRLTLPAASTSAAASAWPRSSTRCGRRGPGASATSPTSARLGAWASAAARRRLRPGQPAARRRAGRPDGAVALPADHPPLPQPALPARRGRPGGPGLDPDDAARLGGAGGARAGAQRGRRRSTATGPGS